MWSENLLLKILKKYTNERPLISLLIEGPIFFLNSSSPIQGVCKLACANLHSKNAPGLQVLPEIIEFNVKSWIILHNKVAAIQFLVGAPRTLKGWCRDHSNCLEFSFSYVGKKGQSLPNI